jgi:hypothetical protein
MGIYIQHLPYEVNLDSAELLDMNIFAVRADFASMNEVTVYSGHVQNFELRKVREMYDPHKSNTSIRPSSSAAPVFSYIYLTLTLTTNPNR